MWQMVLVLLVVAAVSVYIVRHFVRITRSETPTCGHCAGCPCTPSSTVPRECNPEQGNPCACENPPQEG
ncbi:MAG TPA: FeoB-associated Cys-rich membrane protein [Syntrophobacteraceae bacterium]|nr:FeoB-associated Cys-rich membrane protein [Syntrophobacteraceae bacterium]